MEYEQDVGSGKAKTNLQSRKFIDTQDETSSREICFDENDKIIKITNDTFTNTSNMVALKEDINKIVDKYKGLSKMNKEHLNMYSISESNATMSLQNIAGISLSTSKKNIFISHNCSEIKFKDQSYRNLLPSKSGEQNKQFTSLCKRNYSDKATYCRPTISYNQKYMYKIMQKNIKLERLVQNILLACQQERKRVMWNNYINDLKNKHGIRETYFRKSYLTKNRTMNSEMADDCHYTKNSKYPNSYKEILDDVNYIYNDSEKKQTKVKYKHDKIDSISQKYPSCIEGRCNVLEKEKSNLNMCDSNEMNNNFEVELNKRLYCLLNTTMIYDVIGNRNFINLKSVGAQTENHLDHLNNNKNSSSANISNELFTRVYNNEPYKKYSDSNIKNKESKKKYVKPKSEMNLEIQLESLVESINKFMKELKDYRTKNVVSTNVSQSYNASTYFEDESVGEIESNKHNMTTKNSTQDILTEKINSSLYGNNENPKLYSKDDVIDFNKNCKHGSLIFNVTHADQQYSDVPTFEEPTRDSCKEVTNRTLESNNIEESENILSMFQPSKNICYSKENFNINESNQLKEDATKIISVAINTDPLSLLGLLKISSDALKGLISYMPQINYYYYLSQLHKSLVGDRPNCTCHLYNTDDTPQMDGQNEKHNNDRKERSCCVYQQLFDIPCPVGPFKCNYCGKKFTRAYCWELHQISCAKRSQRRHGSRNLLLLK